MTMTNDPLMSGLTEALAKIHDAATQLLEVTTGYRQQCCAAGYSETAAECMAMQLHGVLVALMFKASTP